MSDAAEIFSPEFAAWPWPTYRVLRERGPLLKFEQETPEGRVPIWVTTRHDVTCEILRDPRASAEKFPPEALRRIAEQPDSPMATVARTTLAMMLVRDAPDHTRLRNLVNKAFTPRHVETLRERVQARVDELVGRALARGEMDVVHDLADPLPVAVIADLLGLPRKDQGRLKRWADAIVTFLDGSLREAGLGAAAVAIEQMNDFLREQIELRRGEPRDDLLSDLIAARDEQDRLSEPELLATAVLLLGAGSETTTHLIGNGLHALLTWPDELARLRAQPERIRPAVEEMLRWDSPVQVTSRRFVEDVEVAGVRVPAGDEVNVFLGAANRDPAVFPEPDRFDIAREDGGRHVAFGLGTHFCLGAALARLEAQIALGSLVAAAPELKLASDDPPRRPGIVLRGFRSLPVRF